MENRIPAPPRPRCAPGARPVRARCSAGGVLRVSLGDLGAPRASGYRGHPPEFRGRSGIRGHVWGRGGFRGSGAAPSVTPRSPAARLPLIGCRAASPLSTAVHTPDVGGGPRSTRCARSFPQVGICRGMRGPDRCGTGPQGRVVGNHIGVSSPRVWTAPVDNPVDTPSPPTPLIPPAPAHPSVSSRPEAGPSPSPPMSHGGASAVMRTTVRPESVARMRPDLPCGRRTGAARGARDEGCRPWAAESRPLEPDLASTSEGTSP
ncbi:hypothetical protein DEU33_1917 [Kocuria sp. AG109]|nr:hypothetical protein DEU33_1917 [Kocuria sp. AG109]